MKSIKLIYYACGIVALAIIVPFAIEGILYNMLGALVIGVVLLPAVIVCHFIERYILKRRGER